MCAVEEPLLDGTNPVPDTYFTASTEDVGFEAYKARMSADSCWGPTYDEMIADPPTCYLQVGQVCVT